MGGSKVTLTYKLDGSESRNTLTSPGGDSIDSMSTARWDGPKRLQEVIARELHAGTAGWRVKLVARATHGLQLHPLQLLDHLAG
jgi:hypothetical protein